MVRTRFAPSPTGYLHIGGVRTALFNWLFARKHGGQFILRIDDTDQQRNVAEALAPILNGFRWLGLNWDEGAEVGGPHGPYYQSQKLERYQQAVKQLVDKGLAYHDYSTDAERKVERKAADDAKRPYLYSRRWLAETPEQHAQFKAAGRTAAVRLKMPREGACRFHDHICGDMVVEWVSEQDHFITRADGGVLYNLANVVDDFDMQITHVIRAKEHLSNTPRQIFMIEGLGYPRPVYAHVPFVAEPGSERKLSKREIAKYLKNPDFKKIYEHGQAIASKIGLKTAAETFNPVIVDFYEQVGYLPDAIINYLVLLGWSLDDKSEFFSREEMTKLFSLERVNTSPASLDVKKQFHFQERYMQKLPLPQKAAMVLPYLQKATMVDTPAPAEVQKQVEEIVQGAGDRIKVAGDILEYDYFFLPDEKMSYDESVFEKRMRKAPEAVALLRKFSERLASAESFDAASLEKLMQEFLQAEETEIGKIHHALRVAITGKGVSFGLFETLAILGKQRSLARIARALGRLMPTAMARKKLVTAQGKLNAARTKFTLAQEAVRHAEEWVTLCEQGVEAAEAVVNAREEAKIRAKAEREEAKARAKAEREEALRRAKEERAAALARAKAEREAEKARVKSERDAEKARAKAERVAKKATAKAERANKQPRNANGVDNPLDLDGTRENSIPPL